MQLAPAESEYAGGVAKFKQLTNLAVNRLLNKNYCGVGASSISIAFDGQILGCFQDFGHTSIIGDLRRDSLRKIIATRHGRVGNMPICEGCDANKVALSPILSPNKKIAIPIKAAP